MKSCKNAWQAMQRKAPHHFYRNKRKSNSNNKDMKLSNSLVSQKNKQTQTKTLQLCKEITQKPARATDELSRKILCVHCVGILITLSVMSICLHGWGESWLATLGICKDIQHHERYQTLLQTRHKAQEQSVWWLIQGFMWVRVSKHAYLPPQRGNRSYGCEKS